MFSSLSHYCALINGQGSEWIFCRYSHGENVKGAYHCYFGVVDKDTSSGETKKPSFIPGIMLTGSVRTLPTPADLQMSQTHHLYVTHWFFLQVQDGIAAASFQLANIDMNLQKHMNQTLRKLQKRRSQLYLRVIVTNVQSTFALISCGANVSNYTSCYFPTDICTSCSRWWNAGGRCSPSYRLPKIHYRPLSHSLSFPSWISTRCGGKCEIAKPTDVHMSGAGLYNVLQLVLAGQFAPFWWLCSSQRSRKHQSITSRENMARFYRPGGGSVYCV